jgi:hypothetical protein
VPTLGPDPDTDLKKVLLKSGLLIYVCTSKKSKSNSKNDRPYLNIFYYIVLLRKNSGSYYCAKIYDYDMIPVLALTIVAVSLH